MTVCDVCRDPARAAVTYSLVAEGETIATGDRCEEHKRDLMKAFRAPATEPGPARPVGRGGPKPRKVVTLEEIEAMKAARNRQG
jgi:hypothetical protein